MNRLSQVASLLTLAATGLAQTVIPFAVTGSLDSCTVSGTAFNAGGSISVNNFNIQVPQNLIVSLPVVWTPFRDLCSAGAIGFETSVVGNIVNGVVIAGQVQVSQRFAVEGSQGYISAINTDGSLSITGGPKVRINDPDGLFGPKVTSNPFWVADTESPSVTSFSGFPMCIPYSGNIASCLSSNRGTGNSFSPPDPLRMVPFKVGDFIEFSGLRVNGEILASVIVCPSLAITTVASVTVPNYIRIEELRVGVVSAAGNVEVADTRIVGFLSSCSGATVTISAIDVDPCTGVETYRHVGTANPVQDVRCKFDARFAPSTPFTREYRITTNGPVVTTKDGIEAGQYVQPVSEFIFPEVDVPGTFPPANPFTDFRALVQGDFLDGKQYGQLNPFPGPNPPAPSKVCSPADIPSSTTAASTTATTVPVVSIVPVTTTQRVGVDITLTGSNTAKGLTAADLTFKWVQSSPVTPAITITNDVAAQATFNAPKVTAETSFTFQLTICLRSQPTTCGKASTTIKISPTIADTVTLDTYSWGTRQSGTIGVTCSSNVRNGDNKGMSLVLNNGATTLAMTAGIGPGKWTFSSTRVNQPTNLKCVSDLKGESPLILGTATTKRRRSIMW